MAGLENVILSNFEHIHIRIGNSTLTVQPDSLGSTQLRVVVQKCKLETHSTLNGSESPRQIKPLCSKKKLIKQKQNYVFFLTLNSSRDREKHKNLQVRDPEGT